ncbi:hypothetical protein ACFWMJ_20710 [Streptomyces hawaiiensis]
MRMHRRITARRSELDALAEELGKRLEPKWATALVRALLVLTNREVAR